MVREKAWVARFWGVDASATCATKGKVPGVVGRPLRLPVGERVKPVGRVLPSASEKV